MDRVGGNDGIYVGSTINAGAVADALREYEADIWVVAAGRLAPRRGLRARTRRTAGVRLDDHRAETGRRRLRFEVGSVVCPN